MQRKRRFTTFNLSFLDIMSCGFGAVVLIFLMIDHASNVHSEQVNESLLAEVNLLEEDIRVGEAGLVRVRNTIARIDQQVVEAQGLSRRILDEVAQSREALDRYLESAPSQQQIISQLKAELQSLEKEKERIEAEARKRSGEQVRRIEGEGDRQYLTGLKLGGNRILVLLDVSASMLDHSIVNILRRRNMDNEVRLKAPKWRQATGAVEWLMAQFPVNSWYQIYTFNTEVSALVHGTRGNWLEIKDSQQLGKAVGNLSKLIPQAGTSLENVFAEVRRLAPLPDNIILITDGLPTQGNRQPRSTTVTGKQRLKLFRQALDELPKGIPVNVILLPLEGDPMAASSFWKLAMATGGSFLSPSRDWP